MAITIGMARVAIQKRRFFTVRANSNPTTVPRLWCANGRFAGTGDVGGAGAGEDSGLVSPGAGDELGMPVSGTDNVIQCRGGQGPVVGEPVDGSAELVLDFR